MLILFNKPFGVLSQFTPEAGHRGLSDFIPVKGVYPAGRLDHDSEGLLLLHGYGNVFEKTLAPGEVLDVEPGAWLWKDPGVRMEVTTVASSQRGGGIMGAIGGMLGGASFTLNRFTGPGRLGIQSMSYHPPTPEGAQQAGGQSNLKIVADLLK